MDEAEAAECELVEDRVTITDIRDPLFCIILDQDMDLLEREALKLLRDDWYPVGGIVKKGNNWVQVMVREKEKTK